MVTVLLLIVVGAAAGAVNAVAGGGAILLFPLLLWVGLSPIEATATLYVGVLPGFLGAISGYRNEIKQIPKFLLALVLPVMAGATIGAMALTRIDPDLFSTYIPWLVLSAVLLLVFQARIHHIIVTDKHLVKTDKRVGVFALVLTLFLLSIYGGFFGVGIGIMMMAVLGLTSIIKNAQQLSAIKIWYVLGIDLVAISIFLANDIVNLYFGGLIAIGSLIGGYGFARYSRKISSHTVHNLIVFVSLLIVIYLFMNQL